MLTQLTKSGVKLLDHSYSGEIAAGTAGVLGLAQATLADTPGINFAGGDVVYYTGDGLSSGNHKTAIAKLRQDLLTTFPQLDGIKIEHAWAGLVP